LENSQRHSRFKTIALKHGESRFENNSKILDSLKDSRLMLNKSESERGIRNEISSGQSELKPSKN